MIPIPFIIFIVVLIISIVILIIIQQQSESYDIRNIKDLPINRYPFLGAHDSATFTTVVPFASTQSLNFLEQYDMNTRFFDLRAGDITNGAIEFYHDTVKLYVTHKDLEGVILKASRDKEIIILSFTAFKGDYNVLVNIFKYWLENDLNLKSEHEFLNDIDSFKKPFSTYSNNGKYILWTMGGSYIQSNWDPTITVCNGFNNLTNYIQNTFNKYKVDKPANMYMIQAMYQSPLGDIKISLCSDGAFTTGNIIADEKVFNTNRKLMNFFTNNDIFPNILLMDNINIDSSMTIQIVQNKLSSFISKNNITSDYLNYIYKQHSSVIISDTDFAHPFKLRFPNGPPGYLQKNTNHNYNQVVSDDNDDNLFYAERINANIVYLYQRYHTNKRYVDSNSGKLDSWVYLNVYKGADLNNPHIRWFNNLTSVAQFVQDNSYKSKYINNGWKVTNKGGDVPGIQIFAKE